MIQLEKFKMRYKKSEGLILRFFYTLFDAVKFGWVRYLQLRINSPNPHQTSLKQTQLQLIDKIINDAIPNDRVSMLI